MYKLSQFIIVTFITSCTALKQINNEKISTNLSCDSLTFNGKIALVDVEIDNVKTKFIFDTGSTITVLLDSTIIPNYSKKKFSYFGSLKGANNLKVKNKFFTANLNSNLFTSKNKFMAFVNKPKVKCSKTKNNYSGILGIDLFISKKTSFKLDFTNNKICNIDDNQLKYLIESNNYSLIKSICKQDKIFIFLTIEDVEYKFKLDTGYSGNIIMPFNVNLNFKNNNKIEIEGSSFQTISGSTKGNEIYYEKMHVLFGNNHVLSKLNVSESIKAQNIGLSFIKGFDWIIDYKNNKVYTKKNENVIENVFNKKISYYSIAQEKLTISLKEKSQTKYNLGDEIISVNSKKVTADNICELQELLNKTEDWNTLNLEVISK